MGEIAEKIWQQQTNYTVMVAVFPHPFPEILTKQNIKTTVSKNSIWGPFYISKGEGLGGN